MTVYLSLGSNIRPRHHLGTALELLDAQDAIRLLGESPWYETRPWGGIVQANFLNLVCAVETSLPPLQLLEATQAIEQRLGRVRTLRNGPRTIDIDILLAGDTRLETPALTIPHPGLLERDFMLVPLLDLAPDARLPGGERLIDKCAHLSHHQIIRKLTFGRNRSK
ncbi:2-amino-4-hydroxy-6-hydroxymethyldihydropteridine diphosphokinase [Candidatus Thiosymbion oneisti]|uniref:2-amino-4-hydroxy-6- hydroxymethyldihydropteridine diphosphokinase n=1 Tax=Candidatus Thiosymbion oneisti TaxID=589554 RepID=UPI000B2ABAE0|nr:2-amino-4-hydroxy-6-hydroxymethyldihydropteridine diphosphokinase [Candidatus Thiosymbion oneisti]